MSAVKRKLKNTKLIQKCQIIRQIEKEMTNKEASEKFGVPKNTVSTWMKNKDNKALPTQRKCDDVIMNKWTKLFLNGFLFKEVKTFRLMGQYSKKRLFNLQKVLIFLPLKLQMDGWISGKKGEKNNIFYKIKCSL